MSYEYRNLGTNSQQNQLNSYQTLRAEKQANLEIKSDVLVNQRTQLNERCTAVEERTISRDIAQKSASLAESKRERIVEKMKNSSVISKRLMKGKLKLQDAEISKANQTLSQFNSILQPLEVQRDKLNAAMQSTTTDIRVLTSQINTLDEKITDLQEKIQTAQKDVQSLSTRAWGSGSTEIKEKFNEYEHLALKKDEQLAQLFTLEKSLETCRGELKETEMSIKTHTQSLASADNMILSNTLKFNSLNASEQKQRNSKQKNKKDMKENIQETKTSLNQLTSEFSTKATLLENQLIKKDDILGNIQMLVQSKTEIESQISTIDTRMAELKSEITQATDGVIEKAVEKTADTIFKTAESIVSFVGNIQAWFKTS